MTILEISIATNFMLVVLTWFLLLYIRIHRRASRRRKQNLTAIDDELLDYVRDYDQWPTGTAVTAVLAGVERKIVALRAVNEAHQ